MYGAKAVRYSAQPLTGLGECPTFRPSPEEWQDPLQYVASIRETAEPYGMCRIVPPNGWNPPFAIDKRSFTFPTRVQFLHELQDKTNTPQAQQSFFDDYQAFLKRQGKSFRKIPHLNGQEIDLFKLSRVVARRGGWKRVTDDKCWKDVARIMQVT